jgi:hypothetical protein
MIGNNEKGWRINVAGEVKCGSSKAKAIHNQKFNNDMEPY